MRTIEERCYGPPDIPDAANRGRADMPYAETP